MEKNTSQNRVIFSRGGGINYYKKRKLLLFIKKISIPSVFLLMLGSVFYFFLFSTYFKISDIQISGINALNKELQKKASLKILAEKKYNFFSQNNWFLFSEKYFRAEILREFPELDSVKIIKKFPRILLLEAHERETAGIYCNNIRTHPLNLKINERLIKEESDGVKNDVENNKCFYIDKNGIIFDEAPRGEGSLVLKINGFSSREIKIKDRVLNENYFLKLNQIKSSIEKDLSLTVREFNLIDNGGVAVKTGSGFMIYFNIEQDVNFAILALKETLANMAQKDKENLEYIDLRINGKVYYK